MSISERKRILIADADQSVQEVCFALNTQGYRAFYSPFGRSVKTLIQRGVPNLLVVSDLLADMNGISLLRQIRSSAFHLPVILTTQNPTRELLIEAMEEGARTYLTKPFGVDVLVSEVEKLFGAPKGRA